jgi:NAD(P)-dependent dehydrogenase (short-subunit alcohol dehydrogenase family)
MQAAEGLNLHPLALDVTNASQREEAVKQIVAKEGRIDALVNNAGVALGGFLEQVDDEEFRHVFEVNVFGLWALTKLVLPSMREQGKGVIVNLSSISGRVAMPGLGVYAASKFALEGMSEAWRHELRQFGVRVVLVEPASYKTDIFGRNKRITKNIGAEDSPYGPIAKRLEAKVDTMVEQQAGDPKEVAMKILALIEAEWSGLRYPMGSRVWLRLFLSRYLPFSLTERVFDRLLRG